MHNVPAKQSFRRNDSSVHKWGMNSMNKKYLAISIGVLTSVSALSSEAALSSSALLGFDSGVRVFDTFGNLIDIQGSYFSVDTDSDGVFTFFESITISPGSDSGLLIGQTQLAANSHTGAPNGTEIAPFDSPWVFLGNTGMHQSTSPVNIISDNGVGTVELDFSGWGATWNGIPNIALGGDSANYASETGIATLICATDCSRGDLFTLDYAAHVALDDPNGFGGIYWGIHLEGVVETVPVPAAVWLFSTGLIGLIGMARRKAS